MLDDFWIKCNTMGFFLEFISKVVLKQKHLIDALHS